MLSLHSERGQSVVLLALMLVGLLLFTGLALDAGVIYSGMVNLARAVDAAALAGVVELPYETGTLNADAQANAFLRANGIAGYEAQTSRASAPLGTYQYTITVTQRINLYFLPLAHLDYVRIRDMATAEVNPLVNLYTSHAGKYGQQATVNLSIFGPGSCVTFGDAYSPLSSPWWEEVHGIYHFRLDLPSDYEARAESLTRAQNGDDTNSVVRIEIWDPDSYNANTPDCEGDRRQPCTPETDESETPFYFIRIDENRCGCAVPPTYSPNCTTLTRYTLYYFRQRADGTFEHMPLTTYEKGGLEGDTDMLWVSPPGFELDIPPDIYESPAGIRTLFLDIQTLSGSSENGFDLWAGPRYSNVPAEVNARNKWIVQHPGGHDSAGATWFAIGRLPMNSNSGESDVLLTLAYIPPMWEGRTITVSAFDNDLELAKALTVTLDTCPDWQATIELSGNGVWRHNQVILPGAPEHTFYGGYLQARYRAAAAHDTFGWKITGEANPVLME